MINPLFVGNLICFAFQIPDLDVTLKKLQSVGKGSKLDSCKCIELWMQLFNVTADRTPAILGALTAYSGVHSDRLEREILKPLSSMLSDDLELFGKFIRETVDLHAASRGEYRINSTVNSQLGAIAVRMDRAQRAMEAARCQAEDDMGLQDRVRLIHNPLHGWVFRIVRKDESALREASGYTHLETRKDGAYFNSKDLRVAGEAMKKAESEYAVEQESVVETGMSVTLSYVEVFVQLNSIITELDVFVALAHVAANATTEYVRPTLLPMGSKEIRLSKARHPCVEMMAATGDRQKHHHICWRRLQSVECAHSRSLVFFLFCLFRVHSQRCRDGEGPQQCADHDRPEYGRSHPKTRTHTHARERCSGLASIISTSLLLCCSRHSSAPFSVSQVNRLTFARLE